MISLILAGGKGLRLWPESRQRHPKQLCHLLGEHSMLDLTIDRLRKTGSNRILIVTGEDLADEIAQLIQERPDKEGLVLLTEPEGRNTAAAVGLGLAYCLDANEKEILGVFPADHHITNEEGFVRCLSKAQQTAHSGYLVTVGINPQRAETGYGYIERSRYEFGAIPEVYSVQSFREKPGEEEAKQYLSNGQYLWNAGIYLSQVGRLKQEFALHLPEIYEAIQKGYDGYRLSYKNLPKISLDYGLAERSACMAVVPGDFGWCDLGSWNTLSEVLEPDEANNCCAGRDVVLLNSANCVVRQRHRPVVLFGVEDLVVVENEDVVFVTRRQCSQDIRKVIDCLQQRGRYELL